MGRILLEPKIYNRSQPSRLKTEIRFASERIDRMLFHMLNSLVDHGREITRLILVPLAADASLY